MVESIELSLVLFQTITELHSTINQLREDMKK